MKKVWAATTGQGRRQAEMMVFRTLVMMEPVELTLLWMKSSQLESCGG